MSNQKLEIMTELKNTLNSRDWNESSREEKLAVIKMRSADLEFVRIMPRDQEALADTEYFYDLPKQVVRIIQSPVPTKGMGASAGAGSDSYPYTVVKVSKNGRKIWVTEDTATPTKDYDYYNNQVHTFKTNWPTEGAEEECACYTLRKSGNWIAKGAPIKATWCGIGLGFRRKYSDPSF